MDNTIQEDSSEVKFTAVSNKNESVKNNTLSMQTRNDFEDPKPKKLPRSMKKKLIRENIMAGKKNLRKEKKLSKKRKLQSSDSISGERESLDNPTKSENKSLKMCTENETSPNASDVSLGGHVPKKARREEIQQRCKDAMESGQKICIDFGLENHMTAKQCSKLAQQVGRLYGSNRKSQKPAHIYLTTINKEGKIYQECVRKNSGFDNYIMDMSEKSPEELFTTEDIVYLSPDSRNVLQEINPTKVYVIGGLIDESVKNDVTLTKAKRINVQTAKLPIDEYMVKCNKGQHSYNKILTVNQVFDILLIVGETGNWKEALERNIPQRTGFVVKK